jgi:glucose-6-phosphate 1-dehydrogenase
VRSRHVPGNLYRSKQGSNLDAHTNELVIRIQPKEAIYLKINNKVSLGAEEGMGSVLLCFTARSLKDSQGFCRGGRVL